jgi:chromosomal replication initiation ATPase DnaA
MNEKKPEIQIKEILDKNLYINTEDQYEIDALMSRAAKLLKKGYIEFLKQHVDPIQFIKSREVACHIFNKIEREDFNKEK